MSRCANLLAWSEAHLRFLPKNEGCWWPNYYGNNGLEIVLNVEALHPPDCRTHFWCPGQAGRDVCLEIHCCFTVVLGSLFGSKPQLLMFTDVYWFLMMFMLVSMTFIILFWILMVFIRILLVFIRILLAFTRLLLVFKLILSVSGDFILLFDDF